MCMVRVKPQQQQRCEAPKLDNRRFEKPEFHNFEGQQRKEHLVQVEIGKTRLKKVSKILLQYQHQTSHQKRHQYYDAASGFFFKLEFVQFVHWIRPRRLRIHINRLHLRVPPFPRSGGHRCSPFKRAVRLWQNIVLVIFRITGSVRNSLYNETFTCLRKKQMKSLLFCLFNWEKALNLRTCLRALLPIHDPPQSVFGVI